MRILHRHPIANGAQVIAKGWNAGRLNAGKDARHELVHQRKNDVA
jgi:hypothetical protein